MWLMIIFNKVLKGDRLLGRALWKYGKEPFNRGLYDGGYTLDFAANDYPLRRHKVIPIALSEGERIAWGRHIELPEVKDGD